MSFIASPLSYLRLQRYINPTTWISDIVYCVYSVVFTTTAVYLSYLRQEHYGGENFVYTTAVQKPPKSYLRQMYYGGENFVYTTEVQKSPPSKLRQLHYGGNISYILQRYSVPPAIAFTTAENILWRRCHVSWVIIVLYCILQLGLGKVPLTERRFSKINGSVR